MKKEEVISGVNFMATQRNLRNRKINMAIKQNGQNFTRRLARMGSK
jgi:histidine ammonia-lyase